MLRSLRCLTAIATASSRVTCHLDSSAPPTGGLADAELSDASQTELQFMLPMSSGPQYGKASRLRPAVVGHERLRIFHRK